VVFFSFFSVLFLSVFLYSFRTAFVRAGSRNETAATAGAAQLLSALAFHDTANRSALHIKRETELHGIRTHSSHSRDTVVYGVSALRGYVRACVGRWSMGVGLLFFIFYILLFVCSPLQLLQ
jgi:hypothetical protein